MDEPSVTLKLPDGREIRLTYPQLQGLKNSICKAEQVLEAHRWKIFRSRNYELF